MLTTGPNRTSCLACVFHGRRPLRQRLTCALSCTVYSDRQDSIPAELPRMAKPSQASVLASVRCLAALPACSPDTGPTEGRTVGNVPIVQLSSKDLDHHAKPTHYQAFLHRKVASAMADVQKRLRLLEGRPAASRLRDTAARTAPTSPAGDPFALLQPSPAWTHSGAAAAAAVTAPVGSPGSSAPAACAAHRHKRSASEAGIFTAAAQLPPALRPPSSVRPTTPDMSDDCTTPTAPAPQPSRDWGATGGEVSVEQRRSMSGSAAPGEAAAAVTSLCSGHRPHGQAPPPPPLPQRQERQHRQQQHSGRCAGQQLPHPQQQHALRPAGAASAPAHAAGGQATQLPRGNAAPPGPSPGAMAPVPSVAQAAGAFAGQAGRTQAAAQQASAASGQQPQRHPVPVYGGTLHPPPPRHRPTAALQPPVRPPQQAPQPPQQVTGPGSMQATPRQEEGALARCQPPLLCDLPAPSLTLQQLVARGTYHQGGTAAREGARKQPQPPPQSQQLELQHPRMQPRGQRPEEQHGTNNPHRNLTDALEAPSNARLRGALEATAAAAAACYHRQLAALPAMDQVLRSWPLASLSQSFCRGGSSGVSSLAGSGAGAALPHSPTAADQPPQLEKRPLMRYVQTALPRRTAAAELDLQALQRQRGGAVHLPLAASAAALPADTCQSRQDLWELFLFHLSQLEATGPGPSPQAVQAAFSENDERDAVEGWKVGSGANAGAVGQAGACTCSCHTGGTQGGELADVAIDSSNDDSDVYITDEGLVCLSSLAVAPYGNSGWQLPFLVRQRQLLGEGCAEEPELTPSSAAAGSGTNPPCPSCSPLCARARAQQPPLHTLYFAEPLRDASGMLFDAWARTCTKALVAAASGSGGTGEQAHGVQQAGASEAEDCPCCQQDEWALGGLSLLVLSHCHVGLAGAGAQGHSAVQPLQLLPLAAAPAAGNKEAQGRNTQAAAAAAVAAALRSPGLACGAQLLSSCASTMVAVIDPMDGRVLAQQRADNGALAQLLVEGSGDEQLQRHWRLVLDLFSKLRRLSPGPYMLTMDATNQVLELRGVRANSNVHVV
ncbi:hypothetical protein Agub_g653 [Astrephomene gubernaculifera]|uniref:Uncharacterized protein n=1 Tax=Astrephomene gubernaculifera TaxID=47775 RepID=A0AAD3HGV2_9CHLO|nr:hypothetical protein Agub_g653 [Astrephomene gubernaculifera]